MGQRNVDRLWPIPRATRHVWIRLTHGPHDAPVQGYVLEWRRHTYQWWAHVLAVTADKNGRPHTQMLWVEAERLTPVRTDPNTGGMIRHY